MKIKLKQIEERLILPDVGVIPPAGPENGELWYYGGVAWVFDSLRGKWLSIDHLNLEFGAPRADGTYLTAGGNASGYGAMMRDGTILGLMARAGAGDLTKAFEVRVNSTAVYSFSLAAGVYYNTGLSNNFTRGDWIGVWASDVGPRVDLVSVILEIAWRL